MKTEKNFGNFQFLKLASLVIVLSILQWAHADSFVTTGQMNTYHTGHTATLLPNGKILLAGGSMDDKDDLGTTSELYDPATGSWTLTGALKIRLQWQSATLLPSGKVLVAGGTSAIRATNSAELYEPATGMWTLTGVLDTAREGHTATLLPDGKVLVAGGHYGIGNSAELYDPGTGMWMLTGAMRTVLYHHTATLLPSGKVLVAGGFNQTSATNSAELYDPATGTWALTGMMRTTRARHSATLLPDGKVLVAGGFSDTSATDSAELYDSVTGIWTSIGVMNTERAYHTATLLPNEKVLVTGGYGGGGTNSAELYDPATGTWALTGPLNSDFSAFTATLLTNGTVLLSQGGGMTNALLCMLYYPITPAIVKQPLSQSVQATTIARFNVVAAGLQLSFLWRKDGVELADIGNTSGAQTSILTLSNVLGADAGGYSVIVSNFEGSVTSVVAQLSVTAAPGQGIYIVTSLADSYSSPPPGSLRQAVINASAGGGGDIIFSNVSGTISLPTRSLPTITNNINIFGPGADVLSITTGGAFGDLAIFNFGAGVSCTISGLTLGGNGSSLSRVVNLGGTLSFRNCVFTNIVAYGPSFQYPTCGGAIFTSGGTLTCGNVAFYGNRALGGNGYQMPDPGGQAYGGAIYGIGGVLALTNCNFTGNTVSGGRGGDQKWGDGGRGGNGFGGAVFCSGGSATFYRSSWSSNHASGGDGGGKKPGDLGVVSPDGSAFGGAISVSNVALRVIECSLTNNGAVGLFEGSEGGAYGGAIYQEGGTLDLNSCFLAGNLASGLGAYGYQFSTAEEGKGGALWINCAANITNCDFSGNVSSSGSLLYAWFGHTAETGYGGGIYNCGALWIVSCSFSGNLAYGGKGTSDHDHLGYVVPSGGGIGGAICNSNRLVVVNCWFSENSVFGGDGDSYLNSWRFWADGCGGGIFNGGSCAVTNTSFTGNSARGGRGIVTSGIPGDDTNAHAGEGDGGGIFNSGTLSVFNSTFYANWTTGGNDIYTGGAGRGGAIYNGTTSIQLNHCTIASNAATGGTGQSVSSPISTGGGIYNSGVSWLRNSILAGNNPGSNYFGVVSDAGYNLSSDASCLLTNIGSLINTDPKLAPLADNGGPTLTMALLPDSPAIDRGVTDSVFTDQRGMPRPYDVPAIPNAADGSDIGAFESNINLPFRLVIDPATNNSAAVAELITSIQIARTNGQINTINLFSNGVYTFTQPDNWMYGPNAFPEICGDITINGQGATLQRAADAPKFRFFYVSGGISNVPNAGAFFPPGKLTLKDLTLKNGLAKGGNGSGGGGGMGGAIFNQGTLALVGLTLTGQRALGGDGMFPTNGCGLGGGGIGQDATSEMGGGFGGPFLGQWYGSCGGFGYGGCSRGGCDYCSPYTASVGGGGGANTGYSCNVNTHYTYGGYGGFGGGGGTGYTQGGGGGFGGGGGGGGYSQFQYYGAPGEAGFGGGRGCAASTSGGGGGGLGGAIFNHGGSLLMTNCTLSENVAQGGSAPGLANCFPGCTYCQPLRVYGGSGYGAGVFNLNGTVVLNSCTFASNSTCGGTNVALWLNPPAGVSRDMAFGTADGGAVYNLADGSPATITLVNTILANSIGATNDLVNDKTSSTQTNATVFFIARNLVTAWSNLNNTVSVGSPTVTGDPRLAPLADNGGPTPTMALLPNSPAIDQGVAYGVFTDQRGQPRPRDIPDISNADDGSDIGAFEYVSSFPVLVTAWGLNGAGQAQVRADVTQVKAIAAGVYHSLALKADGTVVGWGENDFGQTESPPGLTNVTAIAAGWGTSLALKRDGTLTEWGWDGGYGLKSTTESLTNITSISACWDCLMALKSDGTVFVWGKSTHGETNLPSGLTGITAIAGGGFHCLALKSDGTVAAWGDNSEGQLNVPTGLAGVVGIAAGGYHSLALRQDGTVVVWGKNSAGQTNVPPNLSEVVAISGGYYHSLALKSDGSIAAWGDNSSGQTNVPANLTNVVAIAAGGYHNLALTGSRAPWTKFKNMSCTTNGQVRFTVSGLCGDVYQILGSTNLTHWQVLATITNLSGAVEFIDPSATNYTQRFYRILMP